MYPLPKEFDSSFLINRNLEMVCFNANQVYLHFGEKISIVIENAFSYQKSIAAISAPITLPVKQSDLMELLEHVIKKAEGDAEGNLVLTFDNGHILKCFNSAQYESYQIKHGDKVILV